MVGVPKSKGCQTCIQRRVGCDRLRPKCTQCQRYGVDCPGYMRPRKFMDEGPQLHQRFNKRPQSARTYTPESIDQRITPSLAARSVSKQQPVIFGSFVLSAFTRWFGLNKYRVQVPWTAYVAQNIGQSPAFDTAIFCINSIYMGHMHDDTKLQLSSREVYSKALRLFGEQIQHTNAMGSRQSVSITIVLSLFEAYSRTDSDAWARHAAGTALLMAHRGPDAHQTGFDRCLYLSFRSFIVAEAFISGKRCIFERPEWQAHISQIRSEDMVSPRVDGPIALFIDLQDRIFSEVCKIPGLLFQARRLHTLDDPQLAIRELAAEIDRSSNAVHTLAGQLRLAATVQSYNLYPNDGEQAPFIGPIPSTFPQEFANSVLRGSDNCMLILSLLRGYLDNEERWGNVPSRDQGNVQFSDPLPFRIVSRLTSDGGKQWGSPPGSESILPANKWLDMVAASMGLEAFDIVTCATTIPNSSCGQDDITQSAVLALR